jgi:V/A-type H+/Na+-transporting ATPase subunit K
MNVGYILAGIGLGLMIGLSGTGSAIGLVIGGQSVIGAIKKRPETFGSNMILSGLPATQGLYGFVCYIIYSAVVNPDIGVFQGALVFGAGLAMGLSALFSAIHQGKVCAAGINAVGSGHDVFGSTFILAVFPEFYAILALVAAILMTNIM